MVAGAVVEEEVEKSRGRNAREPRTSSSSSSSSEAGDCKRPVCRQSRGCRATGPTLVAESESLPPLCGSWTWLDAEANDGILSVASQKAPASECSRVAPREYGSVASLCAAHHAEGRAAVPEGAWTQVFLGFNDHIAATEDGMWQRDAMRKLCSVLIDLNLVA